MASNFTRDLLDLDSYVPKVEGKWPSLKVVFDNLRCYPILALLGLAMRFLAKSPDLTAIVAFWLLLPIFLFLLLATLAQTAVLLAVLLIGISSIYLQPNERVATILLKHKRWVEVLAPVFFVILAIICFVAAARLLDAITKLVPGA